MNASCYAESYKESQPLPTYYRLYVYGFSPPQPGGANGKDGRRGRPYECGRAHRLALALQRRRLLAQPRRPARARARAHSPDRAHVRARSARAGLGARR